MECRKIKPKFKKMALDPVRPVICKVIVEYVVDSSYCDHAEDILGSCY